MQRTICNRLYDTETSEFLKKVTYGYYGSEDGWEECLFKTQDGYYFLYTNGGAQSKYTKENIKRISAERAKIWLENN